MSNTSNDVDMENSLLNNPRALAMMQSRMDGMVGTLSGYYETLPTNVRARVRALKNLQVDHIKLEQKYFNDLHALECKYAKLYQPLYKKRNEIVNGLYEPSSKETEFNEEGVLDEESANKEADPSIKGIPEFWLTVLKNVEALASNIEATDEEILKHLTDIRLTLNENPMSFTLEFVFSKNEFFSNEVLTKTYMLENKVNEKDPFSFEGTEIVDCKGCTINWLSDDKNPTLKIENKKQKHKSRGTVRNVKQITRADSFFNFFSPPEVPKSEFDEEVDEEVQAILSADFEMGELLRQAIVQQAVLYFTGEAELDDEFDDESYIDDSSEDEEEA